MAVSFSLNRPPDSAQRPVGHGDRHDDDGRARPARGGDWSSGGGSWNPRKEATGDGRHHSIKDGSSSISLSPPSEPANSF